MECVLLFGLSFVAAGIYMIVKKKGVRVFSKRLDEITGSQAIVNGIIALVIGLAGVAVALYDLYLK